MHLDVWISCTENSGISHNVYTMFSMWLHEGRALVFDLISLFFLLLLLLLLCWSAALETRYQPVFRNREMDSLHQMRLCGNSHFRFSDHFVYCHCWDILSQAWIGCNWQQNGIALHCYFWMFTYIAPENENQIRPKSGKWNHIESKKKPMNKYVTYSFSVYARSVMTLVELSRPKQLLANIFY